MPATSDEEVFNFEGNLEQSFYDFLLANGIELATANDPQRLGDDYIGVMISVGSLAEDEHMSKKPGGELEYDHYNYSVEITIHTDRVENAVPSAPFSRYHRELVAKVRNLLSISRAAQVASLNDSIDYYWINRLVASDTTYTAFDNSNDETVLTYEGDFSILTTAWPVA
jgi:hypothetical protein